MEISTTKVNWLQKFNSSHRESYTPSLCVSEFTSAYPSIVMDNQPDMIPRPQTPPHQPNAGVTMSREEMEAIVHSTFPQSKLTNVSAVSTSDSFNNRIYFLSVQQADNTTDEVVLKLNGRYFGPAKVQNEVACLQQVEKHCPQTPSPRVLAWSEDGQAATFTTPYTTSQIDDIRPARQSHTHNHGGWIMTTKVPGVAVPVADLDNHSCRHLGRQMADMVADWRHKIPAQSRCGNLKLCRDGKDSPIIQGIVMDGLEPPEPLPTVNAYQRARLAHKMRELATTDTYAPNRHLLPLLQDFIDNHLPNMTLVPPETQPPVFVFTHYDLAPRNVLVSGWPPHITGIVDFEFAGFFHPMEEFVNDCIGGRADWPASLYAAYQERLEERGVATPAGSVDREVWNRNYWLEMVVSYVAPWWQPGEYTGQGLRDELRGAEAVVVDALEKVLRRPGEQMPVPAYGDGAGDLGVER
ncbi:Protein kinase-like domain protein [Metarhizium guizhouense ARSEF 977]|uniref:Protein kinase-like domain protein n=1 Tax=Metarhizium guizhouense (strain ARSEF 977) TaxID=1276136 RepID=A0A0B4GSC1_METGA|nr:Protein kinase-like domain protein [Metarhizium guizhouense ARSEF 977]